MNQMKMEQNGLVKLIQTAIGKTGGSVVAIRSISFPYRVTAGKGYVPIDVAVSLDGNGFLERAYFCLEKDDLNAPVAVPVENFEV